MSNITPQKANLNRGAWANLENKERVFAKNEKLVFVLTGPVYLDELPSLPNAVLPHRVPSGYWKIITLEDKNDGLQVASFYLMQDTPRSADFCEYSVSLSDIEHLTGLQFLVDAVPLEIHDLFAELGC